MRVVPIFVIALVAACGSEQDSTSSSLTRAEGACGTFETHVIGVYNPGGSGTVVIERKGNYALVVSAHEATTWTISAEPGATIDHIYAVGYHRQTVIAPAGVEVVSESHDDGTADANGYAYPDDDTRHLLELVSARVHHDATSFHGCYDAAHWTIGADMMATSECGQQYDAVLDCAPGNNGSSCGGSGSGSGSGSGIY